MTIAQVAIPYVDKRAFGNGVVGWLQQGLPSLESDPVSDGVGCTVALFAYLTQIWLKTCVPVLADTSQTLFGVEGDGEISMIFQQDGSLVSRLLIDVVHVPNDVDMVFGTEPLMYLGRCGFFVDTAENMQVTFGERKFNLGISAGAQFLGPAQFINHRQTCFFPDNPGYNGVWYQLKPGVIANISVGGQQNGRGVFAEFGTVTPIRFNPLAGGWKPYDAFHVNDPSPLFNGGGQPL